MMRSYVIDVQALRADALDAIRARLVKMIDDINAGPLKAEALPLREIEQPEAAGQATVDGRPLTGREVEILLCLMRGCSNKEIARDLAITDTTVKVHAKALFRKLGVQNRTQAALWAQARGLHPQAPPPERTGQRYRPRG